MEVNDELFKSINNLYKNAGYIDRYSGDLLVTISLCMSFFLVIIYFWIKSNIKPIQQNWAAERCSPIILPFAGIVAPQTSESAFEYTASNFTYCTQTILQNIGQYALAPFYYIMSC